jgi:hypothetical protein
LTTEVEKARTQDKVEFPSIQMRDRKESDIPMAIKSLEEDELQISELTEIERNQQAEVSTHLKKVIGYLDTPMQIDPAAFCDVVLTPEGKINLVNNGALIGSIPVEKLPGSVLLRVLGETIPEIKRLLVERKGQMAGRTDIYDKSIKEFRKVSAAVPVSTERAPAKEKSGPQSAMEAAVSK